MQFKQILSRNTKAFFGRITAKRKNRSNAALELPKSGSQRVNSACRTQPDNDILAKPLTERGKGTDSTSDTCISACADPGQSAEFVRSKVRDRPKPSTFSQQEAAIVLDTEKMNEAITSTQAALDGNYPLQHAIERLDMLIVERQKPALLLLARALLKFELKDATGCVLGCRNVLRVAPDNALARLYETVALHAGGFQSIEDAHVAVKKLIAGREFAKTQGPERLAVIVRNAATTERRPTVEAIGEVTELYQQDVTDRCVAALLALMHYIRWFRSGDLHDAKSAYTIADRMSETSHSDKIFKSILHHLGTLKIINGIVVFKSPEHETACPMSLYGATYLRPDLVLRYPLRVLDPRTKNIGSYIRESFEKSPVRID